MMKNFFTIPAAGVMQCEFSINMQILVESFNSESRCAASFRDWSKSIGEGGPEQRGGGS